MLCQIRIQEPLAADPCMWAATLLTYVGHGGEQVAGLTRVDHDTSVHDFGDLRRLPAQPVERIRRQLL